MFLLKSWPIAPVKTILLSIVLSYLLVVDNVLKNIFGHTLINVYPDSKLYLQVLFLLSVSLLF